MSHHLVSGHLYGEKTFLSFGLVSSSLPATFIKSMENPIKVVSRHIYRSKSCKLVFHSLTRSLPVIVLSFLLENIPLTFQQVSYYRTGFTLLQNFPFFYWMFCYLSHSPSLSLSLSLFSFAFGGSFKFLASNFAKHLFKLVQIKFQQINSNDDKSSVLCIAQIQKFD